MPGEKENLQEKLYNSDMFTCDRWNCRMSKTDCLKRQDQKIATTNNYWGSKTPPAFPECQGCLQGIKIRMDRMMG